VYTSPDAAKAYDSRLSAILNYQGKYSGQVWKNWNDAIMGFDIENEAMLADNKYQANDPTGWICARAAHMRSELGGENPIKVASGGVGGTFANGANLASWVVSCPNVDIASVHYYSDSGFSQSNFIGQANGKLVHIEEWTTHQGSGQAAEYASDAAQINALGIPWCLWEVLPSQTCSVQDSDNTGLVINGGIDVAGPMQAADNTAGAQDCEYKVYHSFRSLLTSIFRDWHYLLEVKKTSERVRNVIRCG
jgi:mannan endo-1,4-beta-mannosidase